MTERLSQPSPSLRYPVVVPGVGSVPASGMIIGEAPGRNEIQAGRPFIGASGKVLDEALEVGAKAAGVSKRSSIREDLGVYITNIFKGDVGEGNPAPSDQMVQDHALLLEREIRECKPQGILLLGRCACDVFELEGSMRNLVGTRHEWCDNGPFLYPCYHPAATMYNRSLLEDFRYAVIKFVTVTQTLWRLRGAEDWNTGWDHEHEHQLEGS